MDWGFLDLFVVKREGVDNQGDAVRDGRQIGTTADTPECILVDNDDDPIVQELLADREMWPDSLEEFNRKVETRRVHMLLYYRFPSVRSYSC